MNVLNILNGKNACLAIKIPSFDRVIIMPTKKMKSIMKISGCLLVYLTFVLVVFSINLENTTILVILSTLVGSVVVVASYHEYRTTFIQVPSKKNRKKASTKMVDTVEIEPSPGPLPSGKVDEKLEVAGDGIPSLQLTVFSSAVLKKINELGVEEKIKSEILEVLKDIEPKNRLTYIEDFFSTQMEFESYF